MTKAPKNRQTKRRAGGARRFGLKGNPLALALVTAVTAAMFVGLTLFDVAPLPAAAMATPLVIATVIKFLQWTRRHVAVGIDGVRVVEGFTTELIAFSKIASVAAVPKGLLGWQLLVNFKEQGFRTLELAKSDRAAVEQVARLVERRRHNQIDDESAAALLARRGVDARAWRQELTRLVGNNTAYRGSELTVAEAKKVLADGGAPLDARVGAAVALRANGQGGAMKRLRVVASEVADREKRHSLRQIADAKDDAAMEEAMDAMFADERRAEEAEDDARDRRRKRQTAAKKRRKRRKKR